MDNKNKQKLEKLGLHERFQYTHFSDKSVRTVCILEDKKNKEIALGFSFCSPLDRFTKIEARNKACGRAICAVEHKTNYFPIHGGSHKAIKEVRDTIKFLAVYNG